MRSIIADTWSMSLALSFLAVVAVLPSMTGASAVPGATEVSAFDRGSSPWGLTTSATATVTVTTAMDLRGGGLFGGGKNKSAARIYRESLEEQVLLLNEQLGHARTEVASLRENAKKRHQAGGSVHRGKANEPTTTSKEEKERAKLEEQLEKKRHKEQKEALARLQKEIQQLEKMKDELGKMLETSATKIELLEEQLQTQGSLTAKLEASYTAKIAKLEQTLADVQTAQLEKLKEIHQEKIETAVQESLRAQEAEFKAKLEETTKRLSKEHAKDMEQEKLRSSKAVEVERKKMRKLVRALAMREKKLKISSPMSSSSKEDSSSSSSTAKKTSIQTSSSSQKKPFTAPTSRGTI